MKPSGYKCNGFVHVHTQNRSSLIETDASSFTFATIKRFGFVFFFKFNFFVCLIRLLTFAWPRRAGHAHKFPLNARRVELFCVATHPNGTPMEMVENKLRSRNAYFHTRAIRSLTHTVQFVARTNHENVLNE